MVDLHASVSKRRILSHILVSHNKAFQLRGSKVRHLPPIFSCHVFTSSSGFLLPTPWPTFDIWCFCVCVWLSLAFSHISVMILIENICWYSYIWSYIGNLRSFEYVLFNKYNHISWEVNGSSPSARSYFQKKYCF